MSNPLTELQSLVTPAPTKTFTGTVVSVSGEKVKVQLSTSTILIVWGKAKINDTVLISGKQIVAVVGKEDRVTVYIP